MLLLVERVLLLVAQVLNVDVIELMLVVDVKLEVQGGAQVESERLPEQPNSNVVLVTSIVNCARQWRSD